MRGRRKLLLALLSGLSLAGSATGAALAAPGELDRSFGSGGLAVADFGGGDTGRAVVLQPDGKVVIAGFTNSGLGGNDFAIARWGSSGSLDNSFGIPGLPGRNRFDYGGTNDIGETVALQPDGKIVVGGTSLSTNRNFALARLGTNGGLDGTFGSPGIPGRSIIDFGGEDLGYWLAVQPDGKILITGQSNAGVTGEDFAVARRGSNGLPAGSGDFGELLADFGATEAGFAGALQPDGKIVVAGYRGVGASSDFAVARLGPNGGYDTGFGTGGWALANFGTNDMATAMALQRDGKLVVAGYTTEGGKTDLAIERLGANGTLDDSFAGDGKAQLDLGGDDFGQAVVIQPDGKILVAGYTVVGTSTRLAVVRLQPNGLLDTTFGEGGKAVVAQFTAIAEAVAVQPDGKIVAAGSSGGDLAAVRLEGDARGAPGGGGGPGATPGSDGTPPRCAGKRATIVGTPAADRLRGTSRR
ncbi:MAG: hypothetical protein QOJ59_636, partial [Thermomicrobiales bacterium]|nr:hypothetical protein [Thermomicrobiales bacterium]